jgi:hypothetical protein
MQAQTMKLMCDFPAHKCVPDKYVLPLEKRASEHDLLDDLSVALPIIDLQEAVGEGRRQVISEIMEAGKEFGFFQARRLWMYIYARMDVVLHLPCISIIKCVSPCRW